MAKCKCDQCPALGAAPSRGGARRRLRLPFAAWFFLVVAAGVLLLDVLDAQAEVYHSRESALALAFPAADSVTTRELTLGADEAEQVRARAGAELESRLVRVYEAWSDGEVSARGIIDTHTVRSLPETLFVVVDPSNRVDAVHLLAFHEPVQYRGSSKWFGQFAGEALDGDLAVRRDIAGIAGATMTSNAVTAAVRRCLAVLETRFAAQDETAAIATGK